MEISDSVRLSVRDYSVQEYESAMIHAGNAIEGTASRALSYGGFGSNRRFTTLLRDNYDIFGVAVIPGVDFAASRFRVTLERPKAPNGLPDIADIIYAKHRCSHAHGQALPREYELIDDGRFPCMYIGKGQVKLSRQVILGLLLIVILSPINAELANPKLDGLGISLGVDGEKRELIINNWWGQAERFRAEILPLFPAPKLVLDCSKIENQSE